MKKSAKKPKNDADEVVLDSVGANMDDHLSVDCHVMVSITGDKVNDKPKWVRGTVVSFEKNDCVKIQLEDKKTAIVVGRTSISLPTDSKPSYEPDLHFAGLYKDIYDPENFIIDNSLQTKVMKSFNVFLNHHSDDKRYNFLRSIDLNNCLEGDLVILAESSKYVKILEIDEDYEHFVIEVTSEVKLTVKKSDLKPIDEFITRLKKDDLVYLYDFIKLRIKSVYFDEIVYFMVFSDYFKLTPITLLPVLPISTRQAIIDKLRVKNVRLFSEDTTAVHKIMERNFW